MGQVSKKAPPTNTERSDLLPPRSLRSATDDSKPMAQSVVTGPFFGVTLYASGCDDKTGGDGARVINDQSPFRGFD